MLLSPSIISQLFGLYFARSTQTAVNTDISFPLAPLSDHQRTQDTLHTDEPSPSTLLFEHWKRQHNQGEAGYTFTPLLQVLGIPSVILCYHLQAG